MYLIFIDKAFSSAEKLLAEPRVAALGFSL